MPILFELEPNTVTVTHPQHEDVTVELVQPTLREVLKFRDEAEAFKTSEERFDGYCRFLADHVKRVSGLVDRAGNPVVLRPPLGVAEIEAISKPRFDCMIEADVPVMGEDGKPTGTVERKTISEWFPTYLVNRLMAEDTFSRPLAPGKIPSTSTTSSV